MTTDQQTSLPAAAPFTKQQARDITDQIKAKSGEIHNLLMQAHDGRAWEAMGYESWRAYAVAEFDVSQSRAYRLVDHANVVTAITEAMISPNGEKTFTPKKITEAASRDIKPVLGKVVEEIKAKVAAGADPVTTTYQVIEAVREERKAEKPSKILPRPVQADPESETDPMAVAREHAKKQNATIKDLRKDLAERDAEIESLRGDLAETRANASEMADSLSAYMKAEEGDHASAKEIIRLTAQIRVIESTRDQYMTQNAEMKRTVASKDRQIAKLEKPQ